MTCRLCCKRFAVLPFDSEVCLSRLMMTRFQTRLEVVCQGLLMLVRVLNQLLDSSILRIDSYHLSWMAILNFSEKSYPQELRTGNKNSLPPAPFKKQGWFILSKRSSARELIPCLIAKVLWRGLRISSWVVFRRLGLLARELIPWRVWRRMKQTCFLRGI